MALAVVRLILKHAIYLEISVSAAEYSKGD